MNILSLWSVLGFASIVVGLLASATARSVPLGERIALIAVSLVIPLIGGWLALARVKTRNRHAVT